MPLKAESDLLYVSVWTTGSSVVRAAMGKWTSTDPGSVVGFGNWASEAHHGPGFLYTNEKSSSAKNASHSNFSFGLSCIYPKSDDPVIVCNNS